jgi:putative ABC transport system permease protein
MSSIRRFFSRLSTFIRPGRAEQDLAREFAAHLALLEDEYVRRGMTPDDARVAARRAFGGVEQAKEAQRDARTFLWLEEARFDLRYAVRMLARNPGFAAAAIVTLALGIGASTAIFSVAYGVSMRPLPYREPDRLVRIHEANPANGQLRHEVSLGTFHEWRERVPSIAAAAIYGKSGIRFLAGADGQPVTTRSVSPAFFDVLGVEPMLGPGFRPEKDYTRFTADDEAVLSYEAWQRLFGGRPDAIGATLELAGIGDNDVYRIVGVMPEGFAFAEPVDLWRPSQIVEVPVRRLLRLWRYDRVVARLRTGVTIQQARAELEAVSATLAREFPSTNAGWSATIESLHASIVGSFGRASWLLLASVAVVLLVTCLNVGGLLVARAVARERETAIRIALGAGTWRLVRLRLAEASAIGAIGAGLGLLLAWAGVSALKAAAPPGIPRLDAVALDLPALLVASASAVLAVVVFTMASRRAPVGALRPSGAGGSIRAQALRTALSVTQCAGAAALVVLAVMLTRSFVRLTSIDLGWDPQGVLSMDLDPPMPPELRRPWARYVEWSDRLIARLEATPGIEGAAITTQIPLSARTSPATLARGPGRTSGDEARWPGVSHAVSDGYFDVMGIRLVSGRTFRREDRFTAGQLIENSLRPERGVVLVSETTARTLWPGARAIGQALWLPDIDTVSWREVVGVVEDIQFHGVGESPALHVFVPWTQYQTGAPRLVVRGAEDASALVELVRDVVRAVEPGTHIDRMAALDALVSRATAQPRFTMRLVGAFGGLALLLAAVGIYGTLSYLVNARTREIGIRLALGASPAGITTNVIRRALLPAAAGAAIGLAMALALARLFRALFFQIEPLDARSFAGGAAMLLVVALIAALAPARRAARVDPAVALRVE